LRGALFLEHSVPEAYMIVVGLSIQRELCAASNNLLFLTSSYVEACTLINCFVLLK